jgi:hypothetical protein
MTKTGLMDCLADCISEGYFGKKSLVLWSELLDIINDAFDHLFNIV